MSGRDAAASQLFTANQVISQLSFDSDSGEEFSLIDSDDESTTQNIHEPGPSRPNNRAKRKRSGASVASQRSAGQSAGVEVRQWW